MTLGNQSKNCCLTESQQQGPCFLRYLMSFYRVIVFGFYVVWYSPSDRVTLFSLSTLALLCGKVILLLSYQRWTHESVMWAGVAVQIALCQTYNSFKEDCFSASSSYYYIAIRQFHSVILGGLDLSIKNRRATRIRWFKIWQWVPPYFHLLFLVSSDHYSSEHCVFLKFSFFSNP